ncbi:ATP-dependent helicase [Tessaracoccus antarcticus]|uniref:DNA 3'-5' helicase n=1 Tax=Tessaracoccus antarcticus TaxID=2479848 RepID=A0A3M0GEP5_9ACTN|nr:ATP-dependent DNA helicase [Tessaracoccus antarcticus]RMB60063.1 ATP-dependent helicase [Tessaracoccus antarcticus]
MGPVNETTTQGWQLVRQRPAELPTLVPWQRVAAHPAPGVRLVVGGPGTGKTLALVESVAARLAAGGSLERIVVLAASRSAAQLVRREIARRVDRAQVSPRVTTVHGFSLGLLRDMAEPDTDLRLLRAPEQEFRIRELMAGLPADFWPKDIREAAPTRAFASQMRELLSRARHHGLDPVLMEELARDSGDELLADAARFFEQYLTVTDFEGTLDYAELVHRTRLLLMEEDVQRSVLSRFDAVVADDVQELDPAQARLLADLAHMGVPLHAFADPQQRTNSFRGATGDALGILTAVPGATTLVLRDGFRNAPAIRGALDALRLRLDATGAPTTPTPAPGPDGLVACRVFDDEPAELAHVAQQLRHAVLTDGLRWSDLAVIVRSGRAQLPVMARELSRYGVPVEVAGDEVPLAGQMAVQVLLLGLAVAASGGRPDPDQAHRLFTSPLCGMDSVASRRLGRALRAAHPDQGHSAQLLGRSLSEPLLLEGIEGEDATAARALADLLGRAAGLLEEGRPVQEALWSLWDGTPWPEQLRRAALGGSRRANHDLDSVVELFDLAERREDLVGGAGARAFAAEIAGQDIPADTGRELDLVGRGVRLLTAHRAHGGQWRRVWVVGVAEGRWPQLARRGLLLDPRRLADDQIHSEVAGQLGDERRLFHVACSRAAEQLHVSSAQGIEGESGRPSRFLHELGVAPERVHGRPLQRLTAASLVAELRRVATDPTRDEALRRAAALRLARLAAVEDADGSRPFTSADPATWWGLRELSTVAAPRPETIRLSGSRLGALLACPRHWFLSSRVGAEAGRATRASIGDVVHLLAQRVATDHLTLEEVTGELDRVWHKVPFEAEWLSATERVTIGAALARFCEWHDTNPHQLLAVEEKFSVPLEVRGRAVELTGTVDRLELADGRLKVVDIKTGKHMPDVKDMAGFEQLGVYQLAAQCGAFDHVAPGVRAVAPPSLLFLRHGDTLPEVREQSSIDDVPAPEGELVVGPTWVHDKLAEAVAIIDSGEYDARQCSMCRFCQFADSCPALHAGKNEVGA